MGVPSQIYDPIRHLFAIGIGFLGGLIPNHKSNIHPLLMGVILAILLTKIVFGDYDVGYQWSVRDILFGLIVGAEGAFGAWVSQFLYM